VSITATRSASNPIFEVADSAAASIYWPWVINTQHIASPEDTYYLYYSTDHGAGGIYLATAPTPEGPFTDYGLVYNDTTLGNATETPSVVWDDANSRFILYYHNNMTTYQETRWATSTDGINWTRQSTAVISVASGEHTGYFVPFPWSCKAGYSWAAYHLREGGSTPVQEVSYSADLSTWDTDSRQLPYESVLAGAERRIEWNLGCVVQIGGCPWLVAIETDFVSGTATRVGIIKAGRLNASPRSIAGEWTTVIEATDAWESDNLRAMSIFTDTDGQKYLYYQMDNKFGVATLV